MTHFVWTHGFNLSHDGHVNLITRHSQQPGNKKSKIHYDPCMYLYCIYISCFWFYPHYLYIALVKGTNLTNTWSQKDEYLPDNPAESMCWISLTISDNAHSQKEDAGHNQSLCCHDEVCVLFWSSHWTVWMFLPLGFIYNTAWKGATCWPAACHVDLWKAICMTLRVNCMASFTPAELI